MRRRRALVVVVIVVLGIGGAVVARRAASGSHPAAHALGKLPAGYHYATAEPEDAAATSQLFRESHGAKDVAVAFVGTPQDLAPVGVKVVAFTRAAPPDLAGLAHELERDVPLAGAEPRALHGQPVLAHDGDATFSSSALWVHGRLAIVAFAATTAEVSGVLGALIDRNS